MESTTLKVRLQNEELLQKYQKQLCDRHLSPEEIANMSAKDTEQHSLFSAQSSSSILASGYSNLFLATTGFLQGDDVDGHKSYSTQ